MAARCILRRYLHNQQTQQLQQYGKTNTYTHTTAHSYVMGSELDPLDPARLVRLPNFDKLQPDMEPQDGDNANTMLGVFTAELVTLKPQAVDGLYMRGTKIEYHNAVLDGVDHLQRVVDHLKKNQTPATQQAVDAGHRLVDTFDTFLQHVKARLHIDDHNDGEMEDDADDRDDTTLEVHCCTPVCGESTCARLSHLVMTLHAAAERSASLVTLP